MPHSAVRASSLPTFILPCPRCGVRMIVKSVMPAMFASELDDITHSCDECGTELVRTMQSNRGVTESRAG